MADAIRPEQVLAALRGVQDPDLHKDIVELGFVKDLQVTGGNVAFTIELTTPACPVKGQMEAQARALVGALPGVQRVDVKMTAQVRAAGGSGTAAALAGIRNLIAVASGKGGVGKSTVAANLAIALAQDGARTGLLDADIYGPSIPIMFGTRQPPSFTDTRIHPVEAHGIKLMSIGFLAGKDAPVIWRGPMVHKMVSEFLTTVSWGELDYLVVDLPPGTGDAQLTLTQSAPLSGAVIVTTPQDVALEDVHRAVRMFEQVKVPILGVVENMSYYACTACGHREEIFAHGGGQRAAEKYGVPFLGEVPILPAIRAAGDAGTPIVAASPTSPASRAFAAVARACAARLATLAFQGPKRPVIKFL